MLLVSFAVMMVILIIGLIAYFGVENIEGFMNKLEQFSKGQIMPLDIAIPLNAGVLLVSALIKPFMTGFLKMADCGENGEEFNVSTMFSYYNLSYFINIIIAFLIIGITETGLALLCQSVGLNFLGSVISMLISFISFLAYPLIVFGDLNATESIQSSILLVSKQPLTILGLLVVAVIGATLGVFGLCIGIFFTYPFVFSMTYTIYKSIIGIEETNEIDSISGVDNF